MSMQEKIARAVSPSIWSLKDMGVATGRYDEASILESLDKADAALLALSEPTEDMIDAGLEAAVDPCDRAVVARIFTAMVEKARGS